MKKIFILLFGLLLVKVGFSQPSLTLSTGKLFLPSVSSIDSSFFWQQEMPVLDKRFVVLQFAQALTADKKVQLAEAGVQLLGYMPPFAYTASVMQPPSKKILQQLGVTGIAFMPAALKLSPVLQSPNRYKWVQGNNGRTDILIKIYADVPIESAKLYLQQQGFSISSSPMEPYSIIQAQVPQAQLVALANIPFVEYLEPTHPADQTLNNETRIMSGGNVASAPLSVGGYELTGQGVTVGVGDDADPTSHIDLQDRVINRSAFTYNDHGTHVTGTVAGAGIKRFFSRGYAPHATVVSQIFGGIYLNAPQYVNDFGMVVTNNSYGSIVREPEYEGVYDLYSQILDQQAFQLPNLLHVFASGNDGEEIVPRYTFHYGNVLSGYQSAKNVVTVGRTDRSMYASGSSSSGPVRDGRMKPEMTALGEDVFSCLAYNDYGPSWGTSMSAPGVTGGLVLMQEQYKKQFNNIPKGGLMKAILMNGGSDIGLTGPDFRHGYGTMNLTRSLDIIKNNHFFTGTIATGGVQNQTITVPANTAQLKVLVYWHDPAAAPFATRTLVNDLDLEVLDAASNIVYPQKLDTAAINVATPSTTGPDHINNSEQVVIANPVGNYTIRIKGTAVNINPSQEYFVAYDYLPRGIQITAPFTNESFIPNSLCMIQWGDYGTAVNQRKIEYSLDDGANWNLIADGILDTAIHYRWDFPNTNIETVTARIKITEQNSGETAISGRFAILPEMSFSFAAAAEQCEGYCKLIWPAISTSPDVDYQVLMKKGADMEVVGTTAGTNFTVSGLNKDSVYWFAVQPRKAGIIGRRTDGVPYQPNNGGCSAGISNGDLKLDAIINPVTGRVGTASALSASTNLNIQVKNLDDVAITGFTVSYSVNGSAFTSQNVVATIAAAGTYVHSIGGLNFSQPGTYHIVAVVKNNATDANTKNDTLIADVKQLKNPVISLAAPFIENFDGAPVISTSKNTIGLDSLDRWDFSSSNGDGRVRTFVNTGIAKSGNRAITLDINKYNANGATSYLTGTFNLSNYHSATDEVRFDVQFKQHGTFQKPNADNKIFVRGNENGAWIEIYDLGANQPAVAGEWKRTASLDIADALKNANPAQDFSSSTQIRFGQNSMLGMGDNAHYGGYTFDDVRLYTVVDDVEASAITAPSPNSCGLTSTSAVTVLLKNKMASAFNNVPIFLQVDGGAVVSETVPAIGIAPAGVSFTFSSLVNLAAFGNHTIKVWTRYATDNFRDNDTVTMVIINQPVITTYPYIQDFENNNGNYYSTGTNNSWQYGQPNGLKIKTAASGNKVWKTNLVGFYNDEETSYLYSPCFDVRTLTNPTLSISLSYDIEYCGADACDGAWIEYSTDGLTWSKLGTSTTGYNWYNNVKGQLWDSTKAYWHVATTALPTGAANLRLRFVLTSDIFTGGDGVAIDDIHIYNKTTDIYEGPTNSNTITQAISGTAAINFTDAGQLLATVFPNGNNLGATAVNAYFNSGVVRNNFQQYYANRNITIKPTNINPPTNVTVRMYFLDTEADSMRHAKGCANCSVPSDYTKLGIIKYNDPNDANEDGTMVNNASTYLYIPSSQVRKVPYGKGYYAEFAVNTFSEFWLSDGTNGNLPLPAKWISFTAERASASNQDVLLKWVATNEGNVVRYEVEVSKGNNTNTSFVKLFSVNALNQALNTYTYTDASTDKNGIYYYRIKRIDKDGQVSYSETKLLLFTNKTLQVILYPNPVKDKLQILLQADAGISVQMYLFDAAGKILVQQQTTAIGGTQKETLNLSGFASGVYALKIVMKDKEETLKVVKQ